MKPIAEMKPPQNKFLVPLGLLAGLLLAAASTPAVAVAAPSDPVVFEDGALESCVLAQLGSPVGASVTQADMATLTYLGCRDSGISQVAPLAFATELTHLDLFGNQISDIAPLTQLASLGTLKLTGNQISDLPSFSGLTSLTDLYLNYNQISDIAPLASVKTLRAALLQGNQIPDVSPLSGLDELEIVYVAQNAVRDISTLRGLPLLHRLDATNQKLPLVGVTTGDPVLSVAVGIDGDTIPMTVSSGVGTVSGTEITWTSDGPGVAEWQYSFPLGTSKGLFSGTLEVNATTAAEAPEVSLEGTPVSGIVGTSYSYDLLLTGKPSIPEVSVIGGKLPAGLSLSPSGQLTGVPSEAGTFDFEVMVSNGVAERTYSLSVVIAAAGLPGPEGGHNGGGVAEEGKPAQGSKPSAQLANSGSANRSVAIGLASVGLLTAGVATLLVRRRCSATV